MVRLSKKGAGTSAGGAFARRLSPIQLILVVIIGGGVSLVSLMGYLYDGATLGPPLPVASPLTTIQNHKETLTATGAAQVGSETRISSGGTTTTTTHHCLNSDFQPTQKVGVWTMLNDNKQYVRGAIKIGKSIKSRTKTPVDLVVMELQHKPLTDEEWTDLRAVGWQRCTVDAIPAPKKTRPDLKEKFAVLHVWAMTVYETVVFLDSDSYPQNGIDDLIHMDLKGKAVGVTKDIRGGKWVETFNSGVLLLKPSVEEHERLVKLLGSGIEFEYVMSDQGFLNEVYKDNWQEIGFVNNANLALYRFERQFWESHPPDTINIIHYTMSKPWKCGVKGPYGPICKIWNNAE